MNTRQSYDSMSNHVHRHGSSYNSHTLTSGGPPSHSEHGPLLKLMEELNKNILSLSDRVRALEHGGCPPKGGSTNNSTLIPLMSLNTQALRNRPPQSGVLGGENFAEVSQTLFRLVQIQYHIHNWSNLPKSLAFRLNKFVEDINPPRANQQFKQQLSDLTARYSNDILLLVQHHLNTILQTTKQQAGQLDPTNITQAKQMASTNLQQRLGNRLNPDRRMALLDSAAATIGSSRPLNPNTHGHHMASPIDSTPNPTSNPNPNPSPYPTSLSPPNPAPISPPNPNPNIVSITKRRAPDTSPDVSNHSDEQYTQQSQGPSTKKPKPVLGARRSLNLGNHTSIPPTTPSPESIHTLPHIHTGPKETWALDKVLDTTHTIIIGDSNLRSLRDIPYGWEVFCLPGACFKHVVHAVSKTLPRNPLDRFTVILQAGINHRTQTKMDLAMDIDQTIHALLTHPAIHRAVHLGVSYPITLDTLQKPIMDFINNRFILGLQQQNCIPALPPHNVHIHTHDKYGTHHTPETVLTIFSPIFKQDFRSSFN